MKRIATLFLVLLLLMSAAFAEDAVENDALTAIGDELLDRARTLLSDETYEAMFGFGEDILALRAQWAEEMADEQVRPEVYTHPQFSLLYNLLFAFDGAPAPSEEALSEMENGTVLMMANMGMGELGSTYLAAAATLELQAFYALPEDFSGWTACTLPDGVAHATTAHKAFHYLTRTEEGAVRLPPELLSEAGRLTVYAIDSSGGGLVGEVHTGS